MSLIIDNFSQLLYVCDTAPTLIALIDEATQHCITLCSTIRSSLVASF